MGCHKKRRALVVEVILVGDWQRRDGGFVRVCVCFTYIFGWSTTQKNACMNASGECKVWGAASRPQEYPPHHCMQNAKLYTMMGGGTFGDDFFDPH